MTMRFRVSDHAAAELVRRAVPEGFLDKVLAEPDQVVPASGGRLAYQSKLDFGGGKVMLLRVIVDERTRPPTVVTVYRTSKIDKYWIQP